MVFFNSPTKKFFYHWQYILQSGSFLRSMLCHERCQPKNWEWLKEFCILVRLYNVTTIVLCLLCIWSIKRLCKFCWSCWCIQSHTPYTKFPLIYSVAILWFCNQTRFCNYRIYHGSCDINTTFFICSKFWHSLHESF